MIPGMGVAFEELNEQDARDVETLIKVSMKTLKLSARSAVSSDNDKELCIPPAMGGASSSGGQLQLARCRPVHPSARDFWASW
jgi:hypothetical protein